MRNKLVRLKTSVGHSNLGTIIDMFECKKPHAKAFKTILKLYLNSFGNWVKDVITAILMDGCLTEARCRRQSELTGKFTTTHTKKNTLTSKQTS